MENKVLIAVDLSENSLKAVDYVGRILACHADARVTLLNVIKEPSPDVVPDEAERKRQVESLRSETLALMEAAAGRLIALGMPERSIQLKIHVCSMPVSVTDLILRELREGGYSTVVVGRRGVSKREEFLFGSVSSKVVREAHHCTVWVVV